VEEIEPFAGCSPFLADRLALARRECVQEIVEGPIAVVGPVELPVDADQPTGLLEQGNLVGLDKGRVCGRHIVLVDHRLDRRDQHSRGSIIA